MRSGLLLFTFFLSFFFCCSTRQENAVLDLSGSWQASVFMIGDSVSTIDVSHISLNLAPNSRFIFVNNIGQTEAGTFIIRDSLLITTDTMVKPSVEKAMHILAANKDSLALRMNFGGREAVMHFLKTKQ